MNNEELVPLIFGRDPTSIRNCIGNFRFVTSDAKWVLDGLCSGVLKMAPVFERTEDGESIRLVYVSVVLSDEQSG